jgi:hypothetical protein
MANRRLAPPDRIRNPSDRQARIHQVSEHLTLKAATCGVRLTVHCDQPMLRHPIPHRRRMAPDALADRLQGQPGRQQLAEHLAIHAPSMTNTRSPAGAECHARATRR